MKNQLQKGLRVLFKQVQQKYKELAAEGRQQKNLAEGDIVTEVDKAMTDLIVDYFQNELKQSFSFVSEELVKQKDVKEATDDKFTVIFDEIDGTAKMKRGTGSFGTIVAIAEGRDPQFRDVMAAGFLDLARNEYYETYRNEGAYYTENFPQGDKKQAQTSKRKEIEGDYLMGLLLDQSMLGKAPEVATKAWHFPCNDFGVQARHFSWIADGTWDAFITGGYSYMPEKAKNTGEELAGMFRIVKEAGGEVLDWKGDKIDEFKIGLKEGKNHNIVAAATPSLAKEIVREIIPDKYK